MKLPFRNKKILLLVFGFLAVVIAGIFNILWLSIAGGVIMGVGACSERTVNPDVPPPPPKDQTK